MPEIRKTLTLACALAALAAPAAAQAHVTLQPREAPAGGFARLDVRVPNERDRAGTTKVEVQFPPGFYLASYEPVPGWRVQVRKRKLAKAVKPFGEEISEEIDRISWTGDGELGIVKAGQFRDFGLSLAMPDKPGTLTFKALQTYENGEVVRWIGPPDAEEPAPRVELLAAEGGHGTAGKAEPDAGGQARNREQSAAAVRAAGTTADGDDGAPTWLAVVALALGALGLLAGVAALGAARRRCA